MRMKIVFQPSVDEQPDDRQRSCHHLADPGCECRRSPFTEALLETGLKQPTTVHRECRQQVEGAEDDVEPEDATHEAAVVNVHREQRGIGDARQEAEHRGQGEAGERPGDGHPHTGCSSLW